MYGIFVEAREAVYIDSDDEDIQSGERSVETLRTLYEDFILVIRTSSSTFIHDILSPLLFFRIKISSSLTLIININIYRLLNPAEEMDEAIANTRSSQGHETFDDAYLTELCVKRKYMGHRNARFDLFLVSILVIFIKFTHSNR